MKFSDKANIAKTFLLGGIILTSLYSCSSDNDTTEPVVYSKYISEVLDYMPAPDNSPTICQNIIPGH